MATETKAAPAAKKAKEVKSGYKPIKKEKDISSVRIFEIPSGGGIVCKIKSETTVYDKESGRVRQIRYCPGEPSIYKDEQSNNSRRSHG